MNFVADEGVDRPIVERLRLDGHHLAYVAEWSPGASDEEKLSCANEHRCTLITADRDFGESVFRQRLVHAGVILLRLAGLSNSAKSEAVSAAIREHGDEMEAGFTVIMPGRVRIRRSAE
jgi:predicted nuclease of predicted toxin-antitoxin system